jgi:3-mercaptopyruvate sulfurtransferase SseA
MRVFSGFAVVSALALVALALPARHAAVAARPVQRIGAVDLAQQLVASPESWWVVDMRPAEAAVKGGLPGAIVAGPADKAATAVAGLASTRRLVAYTQGDLANAPEALQAFGGEVFVLAGGYEAWTADVLTAAKPPENPTPGQVAELRTRSAVFAHFTGAAAAAPPVMPVAQPSAAPAAAPKKGGGC